MSELIRVTPRRAAANALHILNSVKKGSALLYPPIHPECLADIEQAMKYLSDCIDMLDEAYRKELERIEGKAL